MTYIFITQHTTNTQVAPWSSPSSRSTAQEVMGVLLEVGPWTDSVHLLVGDRKHKEDGQRCGAKGILGPVTRPDVSQYLPRLLPPSLLLTDHYRPENCILGVRCLHHIVLHTACADLRQLNRAEVLYHAVFRLLCNSQPQVTQKHPLSPSTTPSRRSASRHDDVLRMVLTQMEGEHKLALRRVYASALPPLVDRCGITVCRHLKRLERVILEYLELSDPPDETSRIHILLTLNQTLQTAWPRVNQRRGQQLLKAVLRLLVDVSSDINLKDSVKREIF
ncbi:hypothetical protein NQD34_006765 [Periophthalmus magnuspinnatus]|nr:hypothetical protein NQD34_006765 [Periophthalmus magnuspinnatus]